MQTRTHNRNHGVGVNEANAASGGLGWNQLQGWISNAAHYVSEQYLQQIGQVQFGRIGDVYTTSKTVEVSFTGGRGKAAYGQAPYFSAGGSLETPSPGDSCIVWNPPTGSPVLLAHWPQPGDRRAVPYDVEFCGVSSLNEERHVTAINPGNQLIGYHNAGRPFDLLSGDWGQISASGATIALLGEIALIKATPMAQMQFNCIDDSVRLLSRVFEHWFVGGCHSIQVDRDQVNLEFSFTKALAEALGKEALGDPISREGGENEFFEVIELERGTPRERFQLHVGHNADLVHLFVTKPVTGESSLDNETAPVGVAEFFIGADGALSVRSAKSISVSKVSKIRVPKRKQHPWEAPKTEPQTREQFVFDAANPEGRHLATPGDISYRREVKEVGNFLGREDYYPLPTTGDIEDPLPEDGEADYREDEVTLELRDDGSAMILNSAGSSIEMTPEGDIRIHAARDLFWEAGRHVRGFSGGDFSHRAQKHIEFASTDEDFRVKAQKNIHMVTVDQGIVIETFSSGVPSAEADAPESSKAGIVIRSNQQSPIYLESLQDKILTTSKLETAMRVLDPSEKFYVEGGHMQINLVRGEELLEIGATTMKVNLDSRYELVSQDVAIECAGSYKLETLGATNLTTFGFASWFHPAGVEVAHFHPLSEWTHKADSDGDSLGHGVLITKVTVPINPGAEPFTPSDYDSEADPHFPYEMANAVVGFRADSKYPREKWYQTLWQKRLEASGSGVKWDLVAKDTLPNPSGPSAPFPGVTFDDRFAYNDPAPDSDLPVPKKAGDYVMQGLDEYSVPKETI